MNMNNFADFYQFYLSEHRNIACRRMHFLGSTFGLICFISAVLASAPLFVALGFVAGYGCAWVGHFFFEKNKPASFKYPLKSFAGDWMMFSDILRGRISIIDGRLDKI